MAETELSAIDKLYEPLRTEAIWAHAKWDVWRGLYGNRGRIEILRASAAGFFSMLQGTLFDDILLAISRLADQRGSGPRQNLTLDHLSAHLEAAGLTEAKNKFDAALESLRSDCDNIRQVRNKLLGHRDFAAAISDSSLLPTIRAREVDVALGHLSDALNVFERAVDKPVTMYTQFIHTESYNRLLAQLKKALAYDKHVESGMVPRGVDDLTLPALDG